MNKGWLATSLLILLPLTSLHAAEFTGRFSMLGTTATVEEGDLGYQPNGSSALTADQQSVRLMLDDTLHQGEWSLHLRAIRQHLSGYPFNEYQSSDLFRYYKGEGSWLDEQEGDNTTRAGYELDRAVYRHRFKHLTLGIGRQAIDWGSGRLWQPLNVFGAFAPTDLDTDFKSGIDSLTVDYYPSAFSSLTGAYVLSPKEDTSSKNSGALYYRRQIGSLSELSLLTGSVIGNDVAGGSFESAWGGMGWRLEGLYYHLSPKDEKAFFWIGGIDYQFDNGTILTAEWYDNSRGATTEKELGAVASDPLVLYGLQPQLGRQLLGVSVERDITPLLHGSYTLLASSLDDDQGKRRYSLLHQLNLSYSVSNESDLLISLLDGTGKGLEVAKNPQSEFGYLPVNVSLRLRFYF